MRGKTWDAANDRTLLLQIIALKNVKMTGQDWDFIAGKWNDGTKKDAFRKHFQSIRAEADHLIGVVPATGETKGTKRPAKGIDNKRNKKAKEEKQEEDERVGC